MAYGQHQSFYLRDRWLSKAFRHIEKDERFFYDDEAFEKIGLGKNMVKSLRFWVVATNVVSESYNEQRKKVHSITNFGYLVEKHDKFIQFNETAAVLHYHLAKEKEPGTVWYWFFNILNETMTTKEELHNLFKYWVNLNEEKKVSDNSLKRDIDCLIKLYTSGSSLDDPEEVIRSPLQKLGFIKERKGVIYKQTIRSEDIGLSALMYVLLDYQSNNEVETITVDEIASSEGLWGKVFSMDRSSIIDGLNQLAKHPKYPLVFTRTNNLDTVRLPEISALGFLESEYIRKVETLI
ncbi:DUF4007 family protein [Bacillus tianshenii]|nr:DUF4007 family protein [Bacillus tianshenii]